MGIENISHKITPVFRQYGVIKAALFGSVARGEDGPESDIDVLISVRRPFSLIQFIALKQELELILKKPVDVVEYGAIKPSFAESILKDEKVIYEQ